MQPQFGDAATRRALLREAAFREARAAETARILAAQPLYDDPVLGARELASLEYSSLARPNAYSSVLAAPSLPLGLSAPSVSAGILPTAGIHSGGLPLSAAALTRERALQTIVREEAILTASREQARRQLAHEEALLAASRERTLRNLAQEEAMLAAARAQTFQNLAREEAMLAATRQQSHLNQARISAQAKVLSTATQQQAIPNVLQNNMQDGLKLAAEMEHNRREIIHDVVEEEAMYGDRKLRKGKFTQIEEIYGDVLIVLFDKGLVDAEKGTSLRSFLAKALHCAPMRVTKKIAGKGKGRKTYIGRKYLHVRNDDYQYYNRKFQAAREKFLTVLDSEQGRAKDNGSASSDNNDNDNKQGESVESPADRMDDRLWKHRVQQIADYYREYGIGNLPVQKKYRELRDFVHRVRTQYRKKQLSPERIAQLDEIGFIWSFRVNVPFEKRLEELRAFRERFGHCRVPLRYKENPSFGLWASNMRARYIRQGKGKESTVVPLGANQIAALNALGFEWGTSIRVNPQQIQPRQPKEAPAYQAQSQGLLFANQPQNQRLLAMLQQQQPYIQGQIAPPQTLRINPVAIQQKLGYSYWGELEGRVEANLRALDRKYEKEEVIQKMFDDSKQSSIKEPPSNDILSSEEEGSSDDESNEEFPSIEEDILCDDEYYKVVANLKALDRLYQEEAGTTDEKQRPVQASSNGEEESLSSDDDFSDDEYRQVKMKLKALDRKYKSQEEEEEEEAAPPAVGEEKCPANASAVAPKSEEQFSDWEESTGEVVDDDFSDDEYGQVKTNLKGLDGKYKSQEEGAPPGVNEEKCPANVSAAVALKSEEQFADEEDQEESTTGKAVEKKSPAKEPTCQDGIYDDASDDGEWL